MVDVIGTMFYGLILLSVVLISAMAAFWSWGTLIAPTFETITNSSLLNNSAVDHTEIATRADQGVYYLVMLVILGVVAWIVISLLFERERYAYGG